MKIGFIGAGKVGTALAYLLGQAGYDVIGIYSKTEENAVQAAMFSGTTPYRKRKELLAEADCLFLTVPDQSLADLAQEIAPDVRRGNYYIHCSGALAAEVLSPCQERGGLLYSLHPLQSFAKRENAVASLPGSFFAGQGDARITGFASRLVADLKGDFAEISRADKALYHAGACVASNYLVTLLHMAQEFYRVIGISPERACKALKPLIAGTLQNVETLGAVAALTGPISRGDVVTIEQHMQEIKNLPQFQRLYRELGVATIALGLEKETLSAEIGEKIKKQLECEE